jgi:hypothetical protein
LRLAALLSQNNYSPQNITGKNKKHTTAGIGQESMYPQLLVPFREMPLEFTGDVLPNLARCT